MFSCKHQHAQKNKPQLAKPTAAVPKKLIPANVVPSDTYNQSSDSSIYPVHNPMTFERCPLYEKPDTASKVLAVIPPYISFSRVGLAQQTTYGEYNGQQHVPLGIVEWFKIRTADGLEGFVVSENTAPWTFDDSLHNCLYLVGEHRVGKNYNLLMRIVKLDKSTHNIIYKIEHPGYEESIAEVNVLKSLPLKNVSYALKVYQHADFCGGGTVGFLILDIGNSLTTLPDSYVSTDDGGGINSTISYIPSVDSTGNMYLFADGDSGSKNDYDPSMIPYPKDSGVPADQLIVTSAEQGWYRTDTTTNEIITGKDGKEILGGLSKTTTYYRWDGQSATKVAEKTKKIK